MKLDITGSNNDVENIIQDYIDDLVAFDKHKQKYSLVMNELIKYDTKYAFTGRWMKIHNVLLLNFHCKKCNHIFGGFQYPFGKLKVDCYKCSPSSLGRYL